MDNFVRPDEAEKVKSKIKEMGQFTIIDKVTVSLNYMADRYEAEFSNLGLKGVPVSGQYPKEFDKLLSGGIWCILKMDYYYLSWRFWNDWGVQARKSSSILIRQI